MSEGGMQLGQRAVFTPGEAREDWAIVRAISEVAGHKLPYDTLDALRADLREKYPSFLAIDMVEPAKWGSFGATQKLRPEPFVSPIANFYMTDPIRRESETMAQCTAEFVLSKQKSTGTAG